MAGCRPEDRTRRERVRAFRLAMLDIRAIRERPDFFRDELAKVGYSSEELDRLLAADETRRKIRHEVESRRADRGKGSREISKIQDPAARKLAVEEMKRAGEELARLEKDLTAEDAAFEE